MPRWPAKPKPIVISSLPSPPTPTSKDTYIPTANATPHKYLEYFLYNYLSLPSFLEAHNLDNFYRPFTHHSKLHVPIIPKTRYAGNDETANKSAFAVVFSKEEYLRYLDEGDEILLRCGLDRFAGVGEETGYRSDDSDTEDEGGVKIAAVSISVVVEKDETDPKRQEWKISVLAQANDAQHRPVKVLVKIDASDNESEDEITAVPVVAENKYRHFQMEDEDDTVIVDAPGFENNMDTKMDLDDDDLYGVDQDAPPSGNNIVEDEDLNDTVVIDAPGFILDINNPVVDTESGSNGLSWLQQSFIDQLNVDKLIEGTKNLTGPSESLFSQFRTLETGEKADSAQDFADISDSSLPEEENSKSLVDHLPDVYNNTNIGYIDDDDLLGEGPNTPMRDNDTEEVVGENDTVVVDLPDLDDDMVVDSNYDVDLFGNGPHPSPHDDELGEVESESTENSVVDDHIPDTNYDAGSESGGKREYLFETYQDIAWDSEDELEDLPEMYHNVEIEQDLSTERGSETGSDTSMENENYEVGAAENWEQKELRAELSVTFEMERDYSVKKIRAFEKLLTWERLVTLLQYEARVKEDPTCAVDEPLREMGVLGKGFEMKEARGKKIQL